MAAHRIHYSSVSFAKDTWWRSWPWPWQDFSPMIQATWYV